MRYRHRYDSFWPTYVSVAERKAKARRETAKLQKKGNVIEPVTIEGRTIARSFWGKAWCDHLESFGDFSNRLPRGRTYVRNGSVCHLSIGTGTVEALVSGSNLYHVKVDIHPLKPDKWSALKSACTGRIGSLIELLQGRFSDQVMQSVTDRTQGLFPLPGEIKYRCNCPDWADMCKHIAAVMYGIGARLDHTPELLFQMRGVNHCEMLEADAAVLTRDRKDRAGRRSLAPQDAAAIFGIELETTPEPSPRAVTPGADKPKPPPKTAKKGAAPTRLKRRKPARSAKPSVRAANAVQDAARSTPRKRKARPFNPTPRTIAALRKRLGLSREAFAEAIGVSPQSVINWESASGTLALQSRSRFGLQALAATAASQSEATNGT